MTKLIDITKAYEERLIYIDFEAVSVPLAFDAGLGGEYPYAYSAAIYGKTKIHTYIYEGKSVKGNISGLTKDLLSFLGIENKSKLGDYRFVGWNGGLERNVLKQMFGKEFKYTDLMLSDRTFSAALDDIAGEESKLDLGFVYTRSLVNESIENIFLNRKKGKRGDFEPLTDYKDLRSGAIACLIGAIKYGSMTPRGKKSIKKKMKLESFDINKLTDELRIYSKKDVEDMIDISDNFSRSVKRYKFMRTQHLTRNSYKKEFFIVNGMLKKIFSTWDNKSNSTETFEGYVESRESSYFKRAYEKLECDELDVDRNDEVTNLANSFKNYDLRDLEKLNKLLRTSKLWSEDFGAMYKNFGVMIETYRSDREQIKHNAKSSVKKIL